MSDDHLVSKTYLKWFHDNASKKLYCSFYKLINGKLKWADPELKDRRQICYEKGRFFQKTEQDFNKLFESNWDDVIKHLNKFSFLELQKCHYKKNRIFNGKQVSLILNFIFIHYKRAKYVKDANKKDPIVLKNLEEYALKLGRDLSQNEIQAFHKHVDNVFVTAPQESMRFLKKRPWLLLVNQNKTPFITSCTPVLWMNETNNIGIYTPISPQFAVFILLVKFKEKSGIVIEYTTEANVNKINNLLKNRFNKYLIDKPTIISNKKEALLNLIK